MRHATFILCGLRDCSAAGRWLPALLVRAPFQYRNNTPAEVILGMAICDVHKPTLTLADVLSDEGWQTICDGLESQGKIAPDRDRTALEFRAIASEEATVRVMVERIRLQQSLRQ